jgi:hypothetical protein
MNINGLQEKALDLNQEAMLKVLRSSDVTNATKALRCTTGKCRLALDKLTQFENFMAVATSFLHFITKVYIATASAPIGFLAIASVIQDFDEVINIFGSLFHYFQAFQSHFNKNREKNLDLVYDEFERDIVLIGATSVEDRL